MSVSDLATSRRRQILDERIAEFRDAINKRSDADHEILCALEGIREAIALDATAGKPATDDRLRTAQEAAHFLGISKAQIYELASKRALPVVEIPSARGSRPTLRFRLSDLENFHAAPPAGRSRRSA